MTRHTKNTIINLLFLALLVLALSTFSKKEVIRSVSATPVWLQQDGLPEDLVQSKLHQSLRDDEDEKKKKKDDAWCHPPKNALDVAPCEVKAESYRCSPQNHVPKPCPTSGNVPCPIGYYCPILPDPPNHTVIFSCPNGGVCPEKTSCVFACPKGYYCSDGNRPKRCPAGHYCRSGTSSPSECTFFDFCAKGVEGLYEPRAEIFGIIIVLLSFASSIAIIVTSRYCIDSRQQQRQAQIIANPPTLRISGLSEDDMAKLPLLNQRKSHSSTANNDKTNSTISRSRESIRQERERTFESLNKSPLSRTPSGGDLDSFRVLRGESEDFSDAEPSPRNMEGIDFICDGARLQLKGPGPLRRLVNAIFRIDFKPLTILESVSCIIRPGTVTAIMGPSGGGKTSLMNVLSGKAWAYGDVSGECRMSGQDLTPQLIKDMQHFIGFVPQDDVMPRQCTVNENLNFQARGRLPPEMPRDSIRLRVAACTDALGLGRISASCIGDENVRGISGGQRKRVNIGMEVVAQPSVIFLDEPTSGLDSTTSLVVCDFLKDLADLCGTTIISVIHQPRYEIFEKFDNLVLLAPGGHVVYSGAVSGVRQYFAELGYEVPANCNPADFYMDVISADSKVVSTKPGVTVETLIEENKLRFQSERAVFRECKFSGDVVEARERTGYMKQFRMYLGRSLTLLYVRQQARVLLEALICCGGAALLGFTLPSNDFGDMFMQFAFGSLLFVLFSHFAALPTFGPETIIAKREMSSGFKVFAYYLGKDIASFPKVVYLPVLFSLHYMIIVPNVFYRDYMLVMVCVSYASFGSGMLLSAAMPTSVAQMTAVLASFTALLLSGYRPTLEQIWSSAPWPWLGKAVTAVFPIRWALDALYAADFENTTEFWSFCMEGIVFHSGFNASVSLIDKCLMILLIGLLMRLLTILVLCRTLKQ